MSVFRQLAPGALVGALVIALSACGGGDGRAPGDRNLSVDMYSDAPAVVGELKRSADGAHGRPVSPPPPPPSPQEGRSEPVPGAEPMIAYSHAMGLRLPVGGVEPMVAAHVEACRAAGPATCIVVSSNVYTYGDDNVSGNVSLRAAPDWLDAFMAGIPEATETAGGDITQRSTTAEDLTRNILDTDARLKAQVTLQGRLEGLLETRDGELGELLSVERELARVTGEIESISAQLRAMQLRVAMSSLALNYETELPAFSGSRSNPLGAAVGDFFYNMSAAIAAVITAFAFGLPWLFLVGVLLWVWLRLIWPWVRRRRGKPST